MFYGTEKSSQNYLHESRDTVPEKYDVLRSVVFAIDIACPE